MLVPVIGPYLAAGSPTTPRACSPYSAREVVGAGLLIGGNHRYQRSGDRPKRLALKPGACLPAAR